LRPPSGRAGAVRDAYLAREPGAAACFASLGLREVKGRGAMELLACRREAFPDAEAEGAAEAAAVPIDLVPAVPASPSPSLVR
jgi:hypothetical protein